MTAAELAAFRARQKSRARALAVVLLLLVVLFFAISIVKIAKQAHELPRVQPSAAAPVAAPAPVAPMPGAEKAH